MSFQLGKTEDGRIAKTCNRCEGTGHITYITPKGYTKSVKCQRCNGTGIMLKVA